MYRPLIKEQEQENEVPGVLKKKFEQMSNKAENQATGGGGPDRGQDRGKGSGKNKDKNRNEEEYSGGSDEDDSPDRRNAGARD